MNDRQQQMCSRKARFRNEMEAHAGIGRIKANHHELIETYMRVYECPYCSGWHITKREFDQYAVKMRLLTQV